MRYFFALLLFLVPSFAQDKGTLTPKSLPALANPADPSLPAKELFGRMQDAAKYNPLAIGNYARGCLAGAKAIAVNGNGWQVMRLSRNRMWGHPDLIAFLEGFAKKVPEVSGWRGILIGDISQPRGGPMLTGHASHQIGLDADIWLTPMPARELLREEREQMSATMMVRADRKDIDPAVWREDHLAVIRLAAEHPRIERILVNAAIKKALCREATGDRRWLQKVRPYYGHDYHFHVRMKCPAGDDTCTPQEPVVAGEGCDLDYWFSDAILNPKPSSTPYKPKPPMRLESLPAECKSVLLSR
jgi:penicillin-insensitive murein DD-endopeptidase